jgi:hypothetical protein
MPKAHRITQSYVACETPSDRAYPVSRRRGLFEQAQRDFDRRATSAVVEQMMQDPDQWQGARATDLVGEHMRQRAALADDDLTIDP